MGPETGSLRIPCDTPATSSCFFALLVSLYLRATSLPRGSPATAPRTTGRQPSAEAAAAARLMARPTPTTLECGPRACRTSKPSSRPRVLATRRQRARLRETNTSATSHRRMVWCYGTTSHGGCSRKQGSSQRRSCQRRSCVGCTVYVEKKHAARPRRMMVLATRVATTRFVMRAWTQSLSLTTELLCCIR